MRTRFTLIFALLVCQVGNIAQATDPQSVIPDPERQFSLSSTSGTDLQPNPALSLANVSKEDGPSSPTGYKRFTLKIPIKRQHGAEINVRDAVVRAFFYEQQASGDIVKSRVTTDYKLAYHWEKLPADWRNEEVETLDLNYTQTAQESRKDEDRHQYYGYIVCVYYNKVLQDQAAEPAALLKQYPLPKVLPDK